MLKSNQRLDWIFGDCCDILNDFHHNHVDEFESYVEYVDDGHTGTDTVRESFQRL